MAQTELVQVLREALPYLKMYRGTIMVVKCSGEIARDPETLDAFAENVAVCVLMADIRMIVVHGGGQQVIELSRRLRPAQRLMIVGGSRVTDAETLDHAKMIYVGQIQTDIMAALQRHGLRTIRLDIDVLRASRRPIQPVTVPTTGVQQQVDCGYVGDITGVNVAMLTHQLEGNFTPVISPLASDGNGGVLNINADTVAAEVAIRMRAAKLIMMMKSPGLLADPQRPTFMLQTLLVSQIAELVRGGKTESDLVPKLAVMVTAVRGGVPRAHLLSSRVPDSLIKELFTIGGVGTMVTSREEEKRCLGE